MNIYAITFRGRDLSPPLVRARTIADAMAWARANARLSDGRPLSIWADTALVGNLCVITAAERRHYYEGED